MRFNPNDQVIILTFLCLFLGFDSMTTRHFKKFPIRIMGMHGCVAKRGSQKIIKMTRRTSVRVDWYPMEKTNMDLTRDCLLKITKNFWTQETRICFKGQSTEKLLRKIFTKRRRGRRSIIAKQKLVTPMLVNLCQR